MAGMLRHYLARYRFSSVSDYLGLDSGPVAALESVHQAAATSPVKISPDVSGTEAEEVGAGAPPRRPVSVVIPCFNEELILPYLNNTLQSVERTLREAYDLQFIFVDDGSSDGTWAALQQTFGSRANCLTIRHSTNQGVAAAMMTGIRAAGAEIVCSMDCDCTYDPHELKSMIPLLTDEVDMVTASPYHPLGSVRNVAQWRLTLSQGASVLYRFVLHQKLATYTSCFRVYRRSALLSLRLTRSGFLGVAEMLGRLDLSGGKVVEYPTLLEARLLGRSKMKVLRTIVGHLGLLAALAVDRMRSTRATPAVRKCPDVTTPAV
jgi:glycosyltransferase involved in cell wall biosynthesis